MYLPSLVVEQYDAINVFTHTGVSNGPEGRDGGASNKNGAFHF